MKRHYLSHTPRGLRPYCWGECPRDSLAHGPESYLPVKADLTTNEQQVTCRKCLDRLWAASAAEYNARLACVRR